MVFEYLKKKLQEATGKTAKASPAPGSDADYEERRRAAETLHADGRTDEAVRLLEALAADLAGAGNFPLAVAVRHQIHQWKPEIGEVETPGEDGRRMAARRDQSGIFGRPGASADTPVHRLAKATPFLAELSAAEISGLIESTGLVAHGAGTTVVEEGTAGDRLYIVTRGLLAVTTAGSDGSAVRVGTLTVGDFFGEVAILTGRPRSATVTAESDAECLQIGRESWARLSTAHPRMKGLLEAALAERARLTAEAVVDDFRRRREDAEEGGR